MLEHASLIGPRNELNSKELSIQSELAPHGHVSLYDINGQIPDNYVQTMIQRFESSMFETLVEQLPGEIKQEVLSAHEKLEKYVRKRNRVYKKDLENLENNVAYYLEFLDLEEKLIEKENKVCESFNFIRDEELKEWVKGNYIGSPKYRKKFKEAVESDKALYSRLKKVNEDFGFNSNEIGTAIEVLEENLSMAPDAPLGKKGIIREVLTDSTIFQSGEYPILDRRKRKEITRDIIPTEEEKKREWSLGKKVLVGGITATLVMPGVVGQIVKDDFGHYYKAGWKDITQFISGGSSPGNQNNTEPPVLDNYSQWKIDHFGSLQNPDSHNARDPDHDYVDNLIEYQKGTNPTTPYTFKGLGDFNLIYTYPHHFTNISNMNLTQKEINQFLEKIPNVEPRHWTNKDGSALNIYKDGKYISVSLRDPLVKYYADKTHIEWRDRPEDGKRGDLKLGNEFLHQKSGAFYNYSSMQPPAFYLANGRKGNCVEIAAALASVLVSKGYPCTICDADTKPSNGKISYSHSFLESFIDGKTYIVNYGTVIPREDENGINHYEKYGWLLKNYDPNWLENKNYNYI